MSEGLCWECKQAILDKWGDKAFFLPWQHCHHEPKEKPKCWCENRYMHSGMYVKINDDQVSQMNFCPECGRKL